MSQVASQQMSPASTRNRTLWVIGLLVSLVLAGVVSFYASSSPDGLEKVAQTYGFIDNAEDSAVAGTPLADYGVRGVENERASVALAGVAGVAVTGLLAGGIFMALRRRPQSN
jgi:hypothetical protein